MAFPQINVVTVSCISVENCVRDNEMKKYGDFFQIVLLSTGSMFDFDDL